MIKTYLKSLPRHIWILALIVVVGIFLRTYHFHAWLEFSPDQARDATLVGNVIAGKAPWPLSGPQAGNTAFSLGPLYYYFQMTSAKIFGATPEAMAYPDVFFSILAIPLLFLFLRKYFSINISLAMTALMSVSYFAIVNSRFASNPNSIPFFVLIFLYGLLEMMQEKNRLFLRWPMLVGIGMGVGMQQHTLLLLAMPIVFLAVIFYIWKNKAISWKSFAVAVLACLILNTGQIIHEIKTDGANMQALLGGVGNRSEGSSKFLGYAGLISSCQLQANVNLISSLQDNETCGAIFKFSHIIKENKATFQGWLKSGAYILGTLLSVIFSIGGYYLGWRFFRRQQDEKKKEFLALLALYNIILFLIFIPVAGEVSVRYFIVLFFVPFVIMGFWLDFILEKLKSKGFMIGAMLVGFLLISNISVTLQAGYVLASGRGNDMDSSILGEIEPMAAYIISHADRSQKIYVVGKKMYVKRFFKPLNYLAQKSGVELTLLDDKNKKLDSGTQLFHISKTSDKKYEAGDRLDGVLIEDLKRFNNVTVYILRR